MYVGITVSFNESSYSVSEDSGLVQPILVLSNPSSTDITIHIRDKQDTAKSKFGGISITKTFITTVLTCT